VRADILEGKVDLLMRRLEKMEMEKQAQDLKAAVDGVFWYTKHVHYTLV
jgi:hypothetical protein